MHRPRIGFFISGTMDFMSRKAPFYARSVRAFTLIELLVVIAIIGLMATVAVVAFSGATAKARDMKRKADLKILQKNLEVYFDKYGAYPSTGGGWWGSCSSYGSHPLTGATGYIPNLSPEFLAKLPDDPALKTSSVTQGICGATNQQACYLYNSNGTNYKLLAHCTIESLLPASDPFYDPIRPVHAYMVCDNLSVACTTW
jgi:prepilin-type N-terminal cleavage/methylation domain-containing protein